ncbi:MAG: hypothetical protein ACKVS6_12915 [Planctomycetota bacterium]
MRQSLQQRNRYILRAAAVLCTLVLLQSCTSRVFKRETDTTGTFRTEATSIRFLFFFEMPFEPKLRALELARDSWGDNLRVTRSWSWPNLGFFQFLNGAIIGIRGSVVEGEYGIPPNTTEGAAAFEAFLKRRGDPKSIDGTPSTPSEGVRK